MRCLLCFFYFLTIADIIKADDSKARFLRIVPHLLYLRSESLAKAELLRTSTVASCGRGRAV